MYASFISPPSLLEQILNREMTGMLIHGIPESFKPQYRLETLIYAY